VTLNFDAIGATIGPTLVSWSDRDTLLYALAVGAGQQDPLDELELTTENSYGVVPQALPTFGVIVVQRAELVPDLGEWDPANVLHAEQRVTLERPLPLSGTALVSATLTNIYDKGTGALATTSSEASDPVSGEMLVRTVSSIFVRGAGGFGGERGPVQSWTEPSRKPDQKIVVSTRRDQALLYRLCVDRNPLHSDPTFSRRAGFDRPILHGLCTFGVVGRVILRGLAGVGVARFHSMGARFSKPVFPGDTLAVEVWVAKGSSSFRVRDAAGDVVLDRGELALDSE
jgi:acyl dehydratase